LQQKVKYLQPYVKIWVMVVHPRDMFVLDNLWQCCKAEQANAFGRPGLESKQGRCIDVVRRYRKGAVFASNGHKPPELGSAPRLALASTTQSSCSGTDGLSVQCYCSAESGSMIVFAGSDVFPSKAD
jgi:hypothetical protein